MSKIYVPTINNGNCVTILDHDTIRVFESTPIPDSEINFIDYFIDSNYMEVPGSIIYASGSALPTCIASQNVTTDFYYRNDLADIMIIFFIIVLVCIYFPYRIIARGFGRWLKV